MPGSYEPLTDFLATAVNRGSQPVPPLTDLEQLVGKPPTERQLRPTGGCVDVRVVLEWHPAGRITVDSLGRLAFPVLPDSPGLYRFTWDDKICGHRTYIGETDNLWRRLIGYRHPGPTERIDQRINALLLSHLAGGGVSEVAVATGATMQVDGHDRELEFSQQFCRVLAENAALVQSAVAEDTDIVNLG